MITADHGNADKMLHDDGTPHTSHSNALVPFIMAHPGIDKQSITENSEATHSLQDVAPTVLYAMGYSMPKSFEGKPVFN